MLMEAPALPALAFQLREPFAADLIHYPAQFLDLLADPERASDRRTVSAERLTGLASSSILQAGSVIPAALITGIRSDLPGLVTAQVTQNVYDSPTGRMLLIPQGSRLIGDYDADIAFG